MRSGEPTKSHAVHGRRTLSVALFALRLALGGVFLLSSVNKLQHPYDFLSTVYGFRLVGPELGMAVAMMLPWLELFVGAALVAGVFLDGALLWSISLGGVFLVAQLFAIGRELDISCGCFTNVGHDPVGFATMVRTVAVLLFSMGAYFCLIRLRGAENR